MSSDIRHTTMLGNPVPEDNYAAWAWLIITVGITLYVVIFDVWASQTHHKMMTTQFRLWLFDPVIGPFLAAGWCAVFIGLTYHWFLRSH